MKTLQNIEERVVEKTGNVVTEIALNRDGQQVNIDVRWQDRDQREPFVYVRVNGGESRGYLPGSRGDGR